METVTRKENIRSVLKEYFSNEEEVVFSYLFGSFVNSDVFRDIDIGIYMRDGFELIQLGTMHAEISSLIKCDLDLITLNDIPGKNPTLAYEIVTRGELLFNRDSEIHTKYKRKALLYYFDTAFLRNEMNKAFEKRLNANKFGSRNYE
jgi:predicted nucleotidyltransferase